MICVVLVDDQAVVRAGFRVILTAGGDIDVVGEAATGPEAVRLVTSLRPDVVCLDVRMPGGDGLAATRAIVDAGLDPAPAVLVVTTFDLDEYVFGALEAGASGFVLKDADPDDLLDAVRRLAAGDGMIGSAVTRRVIAEFARRRSARPPQADALGLLTERETDIVCLLAVGRSNAEIAAQLYLGTSTVKSHLGHVMTKTGSCDRLQLALWAHENGLGRGNG